LLLPNNYFLKGGMLVTLSVRFSKAENKELRKWAAARRTENIFSGFEFSSKKENTLAASPPFFKEI